LKEPPEDQTELWERGHEAAWKEIDPRSRKNSEQWKKKYTRMAISLK